MKAIAPLLLALLLGACGLADVGGSAVSAARMKTQEAQQAKAVQAQLEEQLAAARQQEEQRRKDLDAQTR